MTAAVPTGNAEPASDARPQRVGVLLVNLGTPDTCDAKGVRVYLREFLSDPRVIEKQGLLWKLVLNGIILRIRPPRKARDYAEIWNTEKNELPLKTITRAQAEKLGEALADLDHIVVDWAMRYGNPSIRARLACADRARLRPHPGRAALSAIFRRDLGDGLRRGVSRCLAGMRAQPTVRFSPPYYDDPDYIEALAVSINAHLATLPFQPELIVASFHGMPQEYVDKGDPYQAQCVATTDALRTRLGSMRKLILTFQSRFGYDEWLQPYTDKTIEQLAKAGVRSIAVVTPGFAADCLETLEEIAQENAEIFKHNGGEQFAFIPCLNDRARHGRDPPARDARAARMDLIGWI